MGVGFVVAGQAAVVHEPAEGAFDDPSAWLDVEASGGGVALDDLKVDAESGCVFDGMPISCQSTTVPAGAPGWSSRNTAIHS